MIRKIYEEDGFVKYSILTKDIEEARNNPKYNCFKKTGSLCENIENKSLCLIWDNEDGRWIDCDMSAMPSEIKEALDSLFIAED